MERNDFSLREIESNSNLRIKTYVAQKKYILKKLYFSTNEEKEKILGFLESRKFY